MPYWVPVTVAVTGLTVKVGEVEIVIIYEAAFKAVFQANTMESEVDCALFKGAIKTGWPGNGALLTTVTVCCTVSLHPLVVPVTV